MNLAVNARDAMPEGGTLLLAAAPEAVLDAKAHPAGLAPGGYLRLSVADTGTGMSAATLARASEPFFTTKPHGQGTGLGLAMARGFAHQSGGGFQIESAPGQGTTVTLWFPEAADVSGGERPGPARERSVPPSLLPPGCWSWTTMRWCARCWPARWRSGAIVLPKRVTAWRRWRSSTGVPRWIC